MRVPCGLPTTGLQVPTEPVTSQAWHWPPQATSQHTPSTQNPEPHSALDPQAMPIGLAHSPSEPATLQRIPELQLAVSQQTPSTQLPDAHEAAPPAVQLAPAASFGEQAPALQK